MRSLVLGGFVFVGKRLVIALVEAGHEVTVFNRGLTHTTLPATRSDIDDVLDLFNGRTGAYAYVSSIMAYDQALVGVFPWTKNLPTNNDGPATQRHAVDGWLLQDRPILLPHGGLVVGSYGHVDDLVAFMITVATTPSARGEIFNVSTSAVSTRRYINTLADIVGVEPKIVDVPDDVLKSVTMPIFGHLFGARHHAELSTAKADALLQPRYGFRDGHQATYQWFLSQGWADRLQPLVDPVWRATWDFDAEAAVARQLSAAS